MFRYLLIFIIKSIGFHTQTLEMLIVKKGVFIISFFNSAFLILLMNAEIGFFSGKYNDFSKEWYADNGGIIVSSMLFTAVYPAIEWAIFGFLQYLKRVMDQGWKLWPDNIPSETKTRSVSYYFETYAGAIY